MTQMLFAVDHLITIICYFVTLCPFSEPFDFTGNMWPVDFIANQTSFSFSIPIVQDNLPETREEFSLKIVIESPYDAHVTVGVPSRLTVAVTGRYAKLTYLYTLVNAYA